mgnify:CR=1 FL=1
MFALYLTEINIIEVSGPLYYFPRVILYTFSHFFSSMVVAGFGVRVSDWVFGVGVFSWWGLGPVVWGLLGFGVGATCIFKNIKELTWEKKLCVWAGSCVRITLTLKTLGLIEMYGESCPHQEL